VCPPALASPSNPKVTQVAVLLPHYQLQFEHIVRPAEPHPLLPIGCHFQAVHCKIYVATLESFQELLEIVLLMFDASAQFLFESPHDIHFEADQLVGPLGIVEDIRGATFCIGSPASGGN
jgi:hypothetical protein